MSKMVQVNCPGCGQATNVPPQLFGQVVQCPLCPQQFHIAAPQQPAKAKLVSDPGRMTRRKSEQPLDLIPDEPKESYEEKPDRRDVGQADRKVNDRKARQSRSRKKRRGLDTYVTEKKASSFESRVESSLNSRLIGAIVGILIAIIAFFFFGTYPYDSAFSKIENGMTVKQVHGLMPIPPTRIRKNGGAEYHIWKYEYSRGGGRRRRTPVRYYLNTYQVNFAHGKVYNKHRSTEEIKKRR